jgi:hypothetical protein
MLLVGLVFGRWWWATIPLGTIAWVVATIATEAVSTFGGAMGAAAFGAANVVVGVLVYQAVALLIRSIRGFTRPSHHTEQG